MKILDASIEEDQAINRINWREREQLAYEEETPLMKQIKALKQKPKREFDKQERINFLKTLGNNTKANTCRYYDITREELEEVIKHGV